MLKRSVYIKGVIATDGRWGEVLWDRMVSVFFSTKISGGLKRDGGRSLKKKTSRNQSQAGRV